MLLRAIAAAATLCVLGQNAFAGDRPTVLHRVSCTLVRFYVAKYSEAAAEAWARSHGATDADIDSARHCLDGSTMQTANLAGK